MKLHEDRGSLVCEQCGKRGPLADNYQDMMRLVVQQDGFGYAWTHGGLHTCHFYCSTCKNEFDCEVRHD